MAHEQIDAEIRDFVAFSADETVHDRYFVRKLDPPFMWPVAILIGIPTLFVATLVYWLAWKYFIFRADGYLLLTNRRVIYFEKGRSALRSRRYVGAMAIEHVSGCRLFVQNAVIKLFGLIKLKDKKEVYLNIFTEHFDAIRIGAVRSLRRSWFQPAEDMVTVVHEIGARIHELQLGIGGHAMISEPLKFVVLGEGERSFGAWEIISVVPRATLARVLAVGVPAIAGLGLLIFADAAVVRLLSFVLFAFAALPFLRAHEKGYLLLTDRRLIYYHRTAGPWQSSHRTSEVRIEDVSGLRADVERKWGLEIVGFYVLSTTHDALSVSTYASAIPILSAIPGVGRLFRDSNVGPDTLAAVRDLYARIRAVRSGTAISEGSSR